MAHPLSPGRIGTPAADSGTPRTRTLSLAAQNEIQQRRTYTLQGILHPERKGRFFEHFIVTGLPSDKAVSIPSAPPSHVSSQSKRTSGSFTANSTYIEPTTKYTPEILYCYPAADSVKKLMVPQFSFPEGLSSTNVRRVATEIEMNQVVFAPLSSVEESNSSFVFLLTTEESLLYGVCVTHDELLRDDLSFAPKPQKKENEGDSPPPTEATESGFIVSPRCYIFLTKFPFFATHFEVLYSILAQERTHRMFAKLGPDAQRESEVVSLLDQYYKFDVPQGLSKLTIQLFEEAPCFEVPSGDDDQQLVDFCMPCLMKLMPLDQLLLILTAVLQECQVLIVSKQISITSALVMGIIPLMRPYVWQGTFIPIVPVDIAECINSPMPYIMGIQHIPEDSLDFMGDVVIIDVDSMQVINNPEHLIVSLPYIQSLREKLEPLHSMLFKHTPFQRKTCYLTPYSNSDIEIEICNNMLAVLRQYHKEMHHVILKGVDHIPRFNLAKPRHITKLLAEVDDEQYVPFLKRFLSAQHWHFFYDNVRVRDDSIFNTPNATSLPNGTLSGDTTIASSSSESSVSTTRNSSSNSSRDSSSNLVELDKSPPSVLDSVGLPGSLVLSAVSDAFDIGLDEDMIGDDLVEPVRSK